MLLSKQSYRLLVVKFNRPIVSIDSINAKRLQIKITNVIVVLCKVLVSFNKLECLQFFFFLKKMGKTPTLFILFSSIMNLKKGVKTLNKNNLKVAKWNNEATYTFSITSYKSQLYTTVCIEWNAIHIQFFF